MYEEFLYFQCVKEISRGYQGAVHLLTSPFPSVCNSDLHCILLYPARSHDFISYLVDLKTGLINSEGCRDENG